MFETNLKQPDLEILSALLAAAIVRKITSKTKPLQKARHIVADSSCISSNGELLVVTRHNVNSSPKQRKE